MEAERPRQGTLKYWLLGCGGALFLGLLLCVGGGWFLWTRMVDFAWDKGTSAIVDGLEEAGFTASEVADFRGHLQRLRAGHEDGSVDVQELIELAEEVVEGRILPVGMVRLFEHEYLGKAELSPEDGARAAIDLQRFARGLWEESISRNDWERVFRLRELESQNGETTWEREWEDQESVQAILADARAEADRAGIPVEPFTVQLSEEFGRMVDGLLYD